MEPGIYIETKEAPAYRWHRKRHLYIVYRDAAGNAYVIRGGPESFASIPFGGDLAVEAGVPLAESADRYEEGETPETRRARKVDVQDRDPARVFDQMKAAAKQVGAAGIDYDVAPMQNSNSLIRHLFEAAALDPGDAYSPSNPARPSAFGPSPLAERTRGRRVLSLLED